MLIAYTLISTISILLLPVFTVNYNRKISCYYNEKEK